MTDFTIESFRFNSKEIQRLQALSGPYVNWPVVYVLNGSRDVYVGESLNLAARLRHHIEGKADFQLSMGRTIIDSRFNKSVCLDLESYLIRLFAGDGKYRVLNGNDGIVDSDYFERETYRVDFPQIFTELTKAGLFDQSFEEIVNSDLFKLSPFKSLNPEQEIIVANIVDSLLSDIRDHNESTSVIQGYPGTGKTVIAIYIIKLLTDIRDSPFDDDLESDSPFARFFTIDNRELLKGFKIGFVVPPQSLRTSVERVFKQTPGLDPDSVVSPFDVGKGDKQFDLLFVDETHRLSQRANQPSRAQNKSFKEITLELYGEDDLSKTQVDWILDRSPHRIFLLDVNQTVRPMDIPSDKFDELKSDAKGRGRFHILKTQMRVQSTEDYIGYIRAILSPQPPIQQDFADYDIRLFTSFRDMHREIRRRENEFSLARLVAGYAWDWKSRKDKTAIDIELEGLEFQWNQTPTDWINSPTSINEIGSIHTVQGYDLNYGGVIIGNDITYDVESCRFVLRRDSYFDTKGKENNRQRGIFYSDDDVLSYVLNSYFVLLTRGIRGTYVYATDPAVHEYLSHFFPLIESNRVRLTSSTRDVRTPARQED